MKKILFVITKSNWGGAQKYVFDLATGVPKNQLEVKVAFGGDGRLAEKLREKNIEIIKIPSLGRDMVFLKEIRTFFHLLKIYKEGKPDIVHLNSSKTGGLGGLAARLSGIKKIIFTVHGFAFYENRPPVQKILIKLLSYATLLLSTDVILINKEDLNAVKRWPLIYPKCHLIYNGISIPFFAEKESARQLIAEKIKKPVSFFNGKEVVGSIGELTKNKGHHYAVESFKNTPENMVLVIIGGGELNDELERKIKTGGLEKRVFLAGFLNNASSLLKAFDIFLLPSIKEGLPYVLLEAGLARLPIVASEVGGVPELIEDRVTGLVVRPSDAKDLAEKLSALAVNSKLKEKVGLALKEKILRNFGLGQMLAATIKLYKN